MKINVSKKSAGFMLRSCYFCLGCRHPVRRIHFNTSTLVTANIPDDKSPRGACITDDDLTAHRRSLFFFFSSTSSSWCSSYPPPPCSFSPFSTSSPLLVILPLLRSLHRVTQTTLCKAGLSLHLKFLKANPIVWCS